MDCKRLFLVFLVFATAVRGSGQYWLHNEHHPEEEQEYMTDYQWNYWPHGFMMDGRFVKNSIGLPMSILKGEDAVYPLTITHIGTEDDTLLVSRRPTDTDSGYVSIKGFKCAKLTNTDYICVSLVGLDDVRKKYCPEVKGTVVYMINKFFIMDYEELYKLMGENIYKVETVKSRDIKALASLPEFTIVRIFTRTPHNMFPNQLGAYPAKQLRMLK